MPLVLQAYLATLAGLLLGFAGDRGAGTGLSDAATAAIAAAALGGLVLAARRQAAGALLLLAVGAALLGWARRERDAQCASDARRLHAWTVRLEGPAAPGGYARASLLRDDCSVRIGISVAEGRAPMGGVVRVSGSLMPVQGAMAGRVARAVVQPVEPPSALWRLRARVRADVDTLFGANAPLAAALLVADDDALPRDLRDRFADSGLVHALSVSGLHVAILAGAVTLLAAALRLPPRPALAVGAAVTALYVGFIGFPPPAVRSAVMLSVGTASRLLQRPTSPWASLALGAGVPLLGDVRTVLDLGYQLSVSGMAALVAAGVLGKRVLPRAWPRRVRTVCAGLLVSSVATVASAPLVAWHFGRLSIVAPLTNLVAAPVIALLQPTLFLALALAPLRAPARLAADAAAPLMLAMDAVARAGAAMPYAALTITPTFLTAVLLSAAIAALLVAAVARFPARPLAAALLALALAVWAPLVAPGPGEVELHMIDVGQGDAIGLRTPRGSWILVDAGGIVGGDAGQRTVLPYLRRRGGDLRALVVSHAHADHIGGAETIVRRLRPPMVWDPAFVAPSGVYARALAAVDEMDATWRRVRPGDSLVVDGVALVALAPDSAWTASLDDANSASTVLLVRYGAVRFLLTGDAEAEEEEWLLRRWGARALEADVLKVAHHGSRTSSTADFVRAVRPRLALVSVGAGNIYRHPSAEIMQRLHDAGAQLLRTDQVGHVVVRTDGRSLTVEASGDRWHVPERSRASPPR